METPRCWGQFHYYRKTSGAFKRTKKARGWAACDRGRTCQMERGAEELRKALALNPEDRDAAKALEAIRALNKTE